MRRQTRHAVVRTGWVVAVAVAVLVSACRRPQAQSESGAASAETAVRESSAPESERRGRDPSSDPASSEEQPEEKSADDRPEGLTCFESAYPAVFDSESLKRDASGNLTVEVGSRALEWDDGEEKSFERRLNEPDLEDTVSVPYPAGRPAREPREGEDPGRARSEELLEALYGVSAERVREHLTAVEWPGNGEVAFNERRGAAEALRAVAEELAELPAKYRKYFTTTAGTFKWRTISGTERLSSHAFGIAIDLNVDYANYWRWDAGDGGALSYRNRIPWAIVAIFEKHGFVWGGKWYHYDTMHFEYRPELLAEPCVGAYGGG